jgi:hypothetical protein
MWPSDCAVLFSPFHSMYHKMQLVAPIPLMLVRFTGILGRPRCNSNGLRV